MTMRTRTTFRILGAATLALLSVVFPLAALAAAIDPLAKAGSYGVKTLDAFEGASIPTIVNYIISAMLSLVGALFFVMFLWGGFGYLTAGGDSQKVQKSQKVLTNAVIGLVIVATAYAIVTNVIGLIQRGATGA